MRIVGHKSPRDLRPNHAPNLTKLQDFCGAMPGLGILRCRSGGAKPSHPKIVSDDNHIRARGGCVWTLGRRLLRAAFDLLSGEGTDAVGRTAMIGHGASSSAISGSQIETPGKGFAYYTRRCERLPWFACT